MSVTLGRNIYRRKKTQGEFTNVNKYMLCVEEHSHTQAHWTASG